MPICPIHKVEYDQTHATCMRKFMGIPDPGGPAAGDSMLPQDVLDEYNKSGITKNISKTPTAADDTDADDKKTDN